MDVEGADSAFIGTLHDAFQRLISRGPSYAFRPMVAGDDIGILDVLANPVDFLFGHEPGGDWAYTFHNLLAAIRRVAGWQEHAITDLSHVITHWDRCPSAFNHPQLRRVIDDHVRTILETAIPVIILYGENVQNAFAADNLRHHMPGIQIGTPQHIAEISFYALTTPSGRQHWMIHSPHPAYLSRGNRVHAAVQLAEQLRYQSVPQQPAQPVHLTQQGRDSIHAAAQEGEQLFGPDDDAAAEEWSIEEEALVEAEEEEEAKEAEEENEDDQM